MPLMFPNVIEILNVSEFLIDIEFPNAIEPPNISEFPDVSVLLYP